MQNKEQLAAAAKLKVEQQKKDVQDKLDLLKFQVAGDKKIAIQMQLKFLEEAKNSQEKTENEEKKKDKDKDKDPAASLSERKQQKKRHKTQILNSFAHVSKPFRKQHCLTCGWPLNTTTIYRHLATYHECLLKSKRKDIANSYLSNRDCKSVKLPKSIFASQRDHDNYLAGKTPVIGGTHWNAMFEVSSSKLKEQQFIQQIRQSNIDFKSATMDSESQNQYSLYIQEFVSQYQSNKKFKTIRIKISKQDFQYEWTNKQSTVESYINKILSHESGLAKYGSTSTVNPKLVSDLTKYFNKNNNNAVLQLSGSKFISYALILGGGKHFSQCFVTYYRNLIIHDAQAFYDDIMEKTSNKHKEIVSFIISHKEDINLAVVRVISQLLRDDGLKCAKTGTIYFALKLATQITDSKRDLDNKISIFMNLIDNVDVHKPKTYSIFMAMHNGCQRLKLSTDTINSILQNILINQEKDKVKKLIDFFDRSANLRLILPKYPTVDNCMNKVKIRQLRIANKLMEAGVNTTEKGSWQVVQAYSRLQFNFIGCSMDIPTELQADTALVMIALQLTKNRQLWHIPTGVGKSYIAMAYACYRCFFVQPDVKVITFIWCITEELHTRDEEQAQLFLNIRPEYKNQIIFVHSLEQIVEQSKDQNTEYYLFMDECDQILFDKSLIERVWKWQKDSNAKITCVSGSPYGTAMEKVLLEKLYECTCLHYDLTPLVIPSQIQITPLDMDDSVNGIITVLKQIQQKKPAIVYIADEETRLLVLKKVAHGILTNRMRNIEKKIINKISSDRLYSIYFISIEEIRGTNFEYQDDPPACLLIVDPFSTQRDLIQFQGRIGRFGAKRGKCYLNNMHQKAVDIFQEELMEKFVREELRAHDPDLIPQKEIKHLELFVREDTTTDQVKPFDLAQTMQDVSVKCFLERPFYKIHPQLCYHHPRTQILDQVAEVYTEDKTTNFIEYDEPTMENSMAAYFQLVGTHQLAMQLKKLSSSHELKVLNTATIAKNKVDFNYFSDQIDNIENRYDTEAVKKLMKATDITDVEQTCESFKATQPQLQCHHLAFITGYSLKMVMYWVEKFCNGPYMQNDPYIAAYFFMTENSIKREHYPLDDFKDIQGHDYLPELKRIAGDCNLTWQGTPGDGSCLFHAACYGIKQWTPKELRIACIISLMNRCNNMVTNYAVFQNDFQETLGIDSYYKFVKHYLNPNAFGEFVLQQEIYHVTGKPMTLISCEQSKITIDDKISYEPTFGYVINPDPFNGVEQDRKYNFGDIHPGSIIIAIAGLHCIGVALDGNAFIHRQTNRLPSESEIQAVLRACDARVYLHQYINQKNDNISYFDKKEMDKRELEAEQLEQTLQAINQEEENANKLLEDEKELNDLKGSAENSLNTGSKNSSQTSSQIRQAKQKAKKQRQKEQKKEKAEKEKEKKKKKKG